MSSPTVVDWFKQLKENQGRVATLCTEISAASANQDFDRVNMFLQEAAALTTANNEICERINQLYECAQQVLAVKPETAGFLDQASELINQAGEAVADAAQSTRNTVSGLITRITG